MTFLLNLSTTEDDAGTRGRRSKVNVVDKAELSGKWTRKRLVSKRLNSLARKNEESSSADSAVLEKKARRLISASSLSEIRKIRKDRNNGRSVRRPAVLQGANSVPLKSRLFDAQNSMERPSNPSPLVNDNIGESGHDKDNDNDDDDNDDNNDDNEIKAESMPDKDVPKPQPKDSMEQIVPENKSSSTASASASAASPTSAEITSFEGCGLHTEICKHLKEKLGFVKPTNIQSMMIPTMLNNANRDIRMQSMTGSGKTLAFVLPIVQRILETCNRDRPRGEIRNLGTFAIFLSPTRELASQLYSVLEKVLSTHYKFGGDHAMSLVPGLIIGGDKRKSEKARLRKGINILVATPGRLLDHLESTQSFNCSSLETLVLDEADRLLDLGFEKKVKEIVSLIREKKTVKRGFGSRCNRNSDTLQIILCSATLQERVLKLAGETLSAPLIVNGGVSSHNSDTGEEGMDIIAIPETLNQSYLICPPKLRLVSLLSLLKNKFECKKVILNEPFKAIIFVSCCDSVDFHHALFSVLRRVENANGGDDDGNADSDNDDSDNDDSDNDDSDNDARKKHDRKSNFKGKGRGQLSSEDLASVAECSYLFGTRIFKLHGSMSAVDRKKIFHDYCKAQHGILLCTDVAARGLDMPAVDCIVQYEAPADWKDYVHRVGRTARNGNSGEAIIFLMPNEEPYIQQLHDRGIEIKQSLALKKILKDAFTDGGIKGKVDSSVIEDRATRLQTIIESIVESKLKKMSRLAFMSSLRAYSTHPGAERVIFHVKNVHTGHWAKSFGLCDAPSQIGSKASMEMLRRTGKKSIRLLDDGDYRRSSENPKKKVAKLVSNFNPASEFDSGI